MSFISKTIKDREILGKILDPVSSNDYSPVNILRFFKRLIGNVWQGLKNDGYENHL